MWLNVQHYYILVHCVKQRQVTAAFISFKENYGLLHCKIGPAGHDQRSDKWAVQQTFNLWFWSTLSFWALEYLYINSYAMHVWNHYMLHFKIFPQWPPHLLVNTRWIMCLQLNTEFKAADRLCDRALRGWRGWERWVLVLPASVKTAILLRFLHILCVQSLERCNEYNKHAVCLVSPVRDVRSVWGKLYF